MKSSQIREIFLKFFEEKGHLVLPSFSLIPQNDPTLLLIGAGMAPLKPYFTGEIPPPHPRVATCQKCVRTPDIEKVGITSRHATFFEMLGNFSFGDYFKDKAIAWAWELVTEGYKIPAERLYVSIYEEDDEAFSIWRDEVGVTESRIFRLGKEDNFWEIGPGPCGPCSEIYYDLGPEHGCGRPGCAVGCDCDRYLEIWNLVFTQFNKELDGSYAPLEQKNIDTGAGLERLALVLQGVNNLFEIDIVKPLLEHFAAKANVLYGTDKRKDVSLRVITEHLRGVTFMAADGIMPANEGRGYVLRRILRRALRHGKLLGLEAPFLSEAVPLLARMMEDAYPEINKKLQFITRIIKTEEERFKETLGQGMEILEEYIRSLKKEGKKVLPGEVAFRLYDTFGFPLDLTKEILNEQGLSLDGKTFECCLEEQRERGRAALSNRETEPGKTAGLSALLRGMVTQFTGYDTLSADGEILAIVDASRGELLQEISAGEKAAELYLVLDKTPFYAEKGGQVGDTGMICAAKAQARVKNTLPGPGEQVLHLVEIIAGSMRPGDRVSSQVDQKRRDDIARNHTCTHLLHRTLKNLFGAHINQAGSYVGPDRLRFDFTHFGPLQPEEIKQLEETVNRLLQDNLKVETYYRDLGEALEMGAVALFDEKYTGKVRVVQVGDYSLELCGGTHVAFTGEIGVFKILSEVGVGAGIRRIEALTAAGAYRYFAGRDEILKEASMLIKASPEKLTQKLHELLDSHKELQRQVKQLTQKLAQQKIGDLIQQTDRSLGVPVLSTRVEAQSMEELREYLDTLRDKMGSAIILLGTASNGKVLLAAAVTKDLVQKGFHAGKLIGRVAKLTGGGGGGRADMAQAGGKDPEKLSRALSQVRALVKEQQEGKEI